MRESMSIKVNCLNPIAACGLDLLDDKYEIVEDVNAAEAVLVDRKSTRLNSSH